MLQQQLKGVGSDGVVRVGLGDVEGDEAFGSVFAFFALGHLRECVSVCVCERECVC